MSTQRAYFATHEEREAVARARAFAHARRTRARARTRKCLTFARVWVSIAHDIEWRSTRTRAHEECARVRSVDEIAQRSRAKRIHEQHVQTDRGIRAHHRAWIAVNTDLGRASTVSI
jgi:hypothetical protein